MEHMQQLPPGIPIMPVRDFRGWLCGVRRRALYIGLSAPNEHFSLLGIITVSFSALSLATLTFSPLENFSGYFTGYDIVVNSPINRRQNMSSVQRIEAVARSSSGSYKFF